MDLKQYVTMAHNNAVEKGFWDKERNFSECVMLIVCECAELIEEKRSKNDELAQQLNMAEECADIFIRLCDLCGGFNIDIEKAVALKMEYNTTRPKLHGKEF